MSERRRARKRRQTIIRLSVVAGLIVVGLTAAYLYKQKGIVNVDDLLVRAKSQIEASEFQAAAIDLKAVISEQPNNRDARMLLGKIYLDNGNPKGALKEYERARELGANSPEVGQGIATAMLAVGRFDDAATEIAINGDTAQPDWMVLRGMLDLAQQRLEDARTTFTEILSKHPEHQDARRGLIQVELLTGNGDLARKEIDTLLAADAKDAGMWLLKGELDLHDQDPEAAAAAFATALKLEPNSPLALQAAARAAIELEQMDSATNFLDQIGAAGAEDPRINFLRASIAEQREDSSSALVYLRKVLQLVPMHGESLAMAAKLHFARGEFSRAQDYVGRILEIEPSNAAAQRMMGAIQLAAGRMDGLNNLTDAAGSDGLAQNNDPGMLALLGMAYLKNGRFEDSQASLQRAAELAPGSLPIRTQLALSRLSTGDAATAIEELKAILLEDPSFTQAEITLAMVHAAEKDFAAARAVAHDIVAKLPDQALAHNVLGYVLELASDATAKDAYQAALDRDPEFHPARINLARLAIAADDRDAGRQHFQTILDKEPFHGFALLGLAALALQDDQLDEAERLWELAREHNPDAVAPRLLLAKHYRTKNNRTLAESAIREAYRLAPYAPQVQSEYTLIMLEAGEFEDALAAAKLVVERNPSSIAGLEMLAQVYNQLGDKDGLTTTLERIAELAPDAVGARVLLGRLMVMDKRFDEAHSMAKSLLGEDESKAAGHELMGDAYAAEEKLSDARQAYLTGFETLPGNAILLKLDQVERQLGQEQGRLTAWLEANPDDLRVRLVRASYLHLEGEGTSAIPEYERLMTENENNPIVLNNLAWLYHQANDERALALAQRAHELAPESPEIMDTYGWIMFAQGKKEQALDLLRQAEEKAPDNPDIIFHVASALHSIDQSDKARARLEAILSKHPAFSLRSDAETLMSELTAQ